MTAENHDNSGTGAGTGEVVQRTAMLEATYQDVLTLVSRTADFVSALKAGTAPGFTVDVGPAYTVESMRHTTRLMQVMAWLLTQRAVDTGEMTEEEAADPKYRLGAEDVCLAGPADGVELLPQMFREMISESDQIYRRIKRLSDQMEEPAHENPVHALLGRLDATANDDSRDDETDASTDGKAQPLADN